MKLIRQDFLYGEAKDGEYIRVNPEIIEAEGGVALGAEYAYSDDTAKAGVRYYYKLEDIDTKGMSTFHGPVSALMTDTGTARDDYPSWR